MSKFEKKLKKPGNFLDAGDLSNHDNSFVDAFRL